MLILRYNAKCDRCSKVTTLPAEFGRHVAEDMLRAAGWTSLDDGAVLCDHCTLACPAVVKRGKRTVSSDHERAASRTVKR